jgi:hypothetical protein
MKLVAFLDLEFRVLRRPGSSPGMPTRIWSISSEEERPPVQWKVEISKFS